MVWLTTWAHNHNITASFCWLLLATVTSELDKNSSFAPFIRFIKRHMRLLRKSQCLSIFAQFCRIDYLLKREEGAYNFCPSWPPSIPAFPKIWALFKFIVLMQLSLIYVYRKETSSSSIYFESISQLIFSTAFVMVRWSLEKFIWYLEFGHSVTE